MKKKKLRSVPKPQPKLDAAKLPKVYCLNCDSEHFEQVILVRYISPLEPTNVQKQSAYAMNQVLACAQCSTLLPNPSEYMSEKMKPKKERGEEIGEETQQTNQSSGDEKLA